MRGRSGASYAVAAAVGVLVSAAIAALLIASKAPLMALRQSVADSAVNALEREVGTRLSIIYRVGGSIVISNDGYVPVRIIKLMIGDEERIVDIYLKPGEKSGEIYVGFNSHVAAVLDDGRIIPLLSAG